MKYTFSLSLLVFFSSFVYAANKPLPEFKKLPEAAAVFAPQNRIAKALKQALSVGVDSAVSRVSSLNGFYKDELIKIMLPPEASSLVDKVQQSYMGKRLYSRIMRPAMNNLVLSMNRAAEDASKKAAPIFLSAIKSMSIPEALDILNGADTAATTYLRSKTYESLVEAFSPSIQKSLDKKFVGNKSTTELWDKFIGTYNRVRESPVSMFLDLEEATEPNLSKYVTKKALNGVFSKVGAEEKKIRENPKAQVTNLLKNVFGKLLGKQK